MENNQCPPKRPRVFAVRNFPPGCGRFASRISAPVVEGATSAEGDAGTRSLNDAGTAMPVIAEGDAEVSLPTYPSGPSSAGGDDARNKVVETLRFFHALCKTLWQEDKSKEKGPAGNSSHKRYDLIAAKILKEKGWYINTGKQIVGSVPGVEVGDRFQYRAELNIIGLHRQVQAGIDYLNEDGHTLATSVVASRGYNKYLVKPNVLIYTGQGGNLHNGRKEFEDQKLTRGNLALKNSMDANTPVRVIRGKAESSNSSDFRSKTFIYDGLYLVDKVWKELGPHGKYVYKFKLVRISRQQ